MLDSCHIHTVVAGHISPTWVNSNFRLYAQCHDTVDNIVVVLLECLDGLLPTDAGLGHDKLNVLGLETGVVNLLTIVFLLLGWLARTLLNGLALVGTISGVVVGSLVCRLCGELLGGGSLSLNVEVLNLGLTKDAVPMLATLHSDCACSLLLTSRCCCLATCRHLGC